jgi:hypothetical protein
MKLIRTHLPYRSSENGTDEYGDLYKAVPEELYDNTILDCVMIRCHHCNEIITYCSEIYDFHLTDKNGYCFCPECAKDLFLV